MPQRHKVRLDDGSVIDLDRDALRSWYERGLISNDSLVQTPGATRWTSLAQAVDVTEWRAPRTGTRLASSGPQRTDPPPRHSSMPPPRLARRSSASLPVEWRRYAVITLGAAAAVTLFWWSSRWWIPAILGTAEERRVRAAASSERQFTDETLGLTLDTPTPWMILRTDHSLFPLPTNVKLSFADPKAGAFAHLSVDTPPRGYLSLDDYLDGVMANRRGADPSLQERSRENAPGGARRALASRQTSEGKLQDVTTTWKNGWIYFTLVAWAPEERGSAASASQALHQGFRSRGGLGDRLRQAVEEVTREVPHLTPQAAEMLMGQSAAQVLEPPEAFRRSYRVASRGVSSLAKGEQKEMGALTSALYATLPRRDRFRLGNYIERVRAGHPTHPEVDREMSRLMKEAVLKLPTPRRQRLQVLFHKALTAGVRTGA